MYLQNFDSDEKVCNRWARKQRTKKKDNNFVIKIYSKNKVPMM